MAAVARRSVANVNHDRLPLFCDAALAARIEYAEAQLIAKATRDFGAAGVVRYVALRDGVIAGGAVHVPRGAMSSAARACPSV